MSDRVTGAGGSRRADTSAGGLGLLRAGWPLLSTWCLYVVAQDRTEKQKPLKALTQRRCHHIPLVKANHKIYPEEKQIPSLDGRAARARMGGILGPI